jgi:hypothetical protein
LQHSLGSDPTAACHGGIDDFNIWIFGRIRVEEGLQRRSLAGRRPPREDLQRSAILSEDAVDPRLA